MAYSEREQLPSERIPATSAVILSKEEKLFFMVNVLILVYKCQSTVNYRNQQIILAFFLHPRRFPADCESTDNFDRRPARTLGARSDRAP